MERLTEWLEPDSAQPVLSETNSMFAIVKKLAEYEDLEEEGRLLYLPCRIGDKIYCIVAVPCDRGAIRECLYPELDCEECKFVSYIIEELPFRLSCLDGAGRLRKGLFVNRDEAEEYLKKMGIDNE